MVASDSSDANKNRKACTQMQDDMPTVRIPLIVTKEYF